MEDGERIYFLSPTGIALMVTLKRTVGVKLDYPRDVTGLVPGLHLGIELTPTEARDFAAWLQRKADEAEDGLPRA